MAQAKQNPSRNAPRSVGSDLIQLEEVMAALKTRRPVLSIVIDPPDGGPPTLLMNDALVASEDHTRLIVEAIEQLASALLWMDPDCPCDERLRLICGLPPSGSWRSRN